MIKLALNSRLYFCHIFLPVYICIFLMSSLMAGCTSTPTTTEKQDTVVFEKIKEPSAYKIKIVNASKDIINDIKYKPCKSHTIKYLQLADNLRPHEKFTINVYSQCVDLLATNAFKKKLVDVRNVDLSTVKTWTIR